MHGDELEHGTASLFFWLDCEFRSRREESLTGCSYLLQLGRPENIPTAWQPRFQITRATAGMRRRTAIAPQLNRAAPAKTNDPLASAGICDFRRTSCSQLTKA